MGAAEGQGWVRGGHSMHALPSRKRAKTDKSADPTQAPPRVREQECSTESHERERDTVRNSLAPLISCGPARGGAARRRWLNGRRPVTTTQSQAPVTPPRSMPPTPARHPSERRVELGVTCWFAPLGHPLHVMRWEHPPKATIGGSPDCAHVASCPV